MIRGRPLAALLTTAAVLVGCQPAAVQEEAAPPFVFRTLELRQNDAQGRPAWKLRSPEARYDLGRQLAQARDLRGLIYVKGQPLYRVSATSGVVLNDGAVVQLEGPTRVERLGPNPALITALRVRWYPRQGRMQLDRQPLAIQRSLELRADRADFDFNNDTLVLTGRPQLFQPGQPQTQLTLQRLQWWLNRGDLVGFGPVQGQRRLAANQVQTLTSPGLSGNTQQQHLVLAAPVQVRDPSQDAELTAGVTTMDLRLDQVSSTAPFQARRGAATLQGRGFSASNQTTTLFIPAGCRLSQPGDQLTANTCRWNWSTQAFQARGGVTLRRASISQITRADHLDGRAASDGVMEFSQPGGRVVSQLRIPAQARSARRRDPR